MVSSLRRGQTAAPPRRYQSTAAAVVLGHVLTGARMMDERVRRVRLLLVPVILVAFAGGAGAATIEVADGVVEVAEDGQCSLIEALENANGDAAHTDCTAGDDGLDIVTLAPGSIYTLAHVHNIQDTGPTIGPNGLPKITTSIVVRGSGATIERSFDEGTPDFRLFHVDSPSGNLTLDGLTLRNGRSPFDGGGIANVGTLTVLRSVISDNSAGGSGGGVAVVEGPATVSHSILSGNSGSGITVNWTAIVSYSTLSNNSGHGVSCSDGDVTLVNSTLSGNSGRGLHDNGCSSVVVNSTLSGNSAGGVYSDDSFPIFTNSVIANSGEADCSIGKGGPTFNGVNVIEDGSCGCTGPSCISGDPQLGELADNGGPTPTHALLAGSIAIDSADDAQCPEDDQRVVSRPIDGEGDGSEEDLDGGCDIGAFEAGGFVATALTVDPVGSLSDGNGVLEPDELVIIAPVWQNGATSTQTLTGTASDFTGPAGPKYQVAVADAEYAELGPAESASCQETGVCYQMEIDPAGADRPARHWDATFEETLSDESVKTWTLHVGNSFADVPRSNPFYRSVETLLHRGVTGGCSATEYCPEAVNSRAQMAVLALKASEGSDYTPVACVENEEMFADVPFDSPFCPWIEELAARHVVSGCGAGLYCPSSPVTRAQMAVFLLKTLEGDGYTPPDCSGVFADVRCPSMFAEWVEDLYGRGFTSGCGTDPLEYCPNLSMTRGQMSVFLSKTFGLTLYGP